MKAIAPALLLVVLLCGSAFGKTETPATLDTVIAKNVTEWGPVWSKVSKKTPDSKTIAELKRMYLAAGGDDEKVTVREALIGYASSDAKTSTFILGWMKLDTLGTSALSVLDAEVARLAKAGDGKAATVRRARELFARQLDESGTLPAAQTAVADALKALEVKK